MPGSEAAKYVPEQARKELEEARKGFVAVSTAVFLGSKSNQASLMGRLFSAHADTFSFNEGVVVFTVLDDGDYNTIEYDVYIHDVVNQVEMWGVQQYNISTGLTQEWGMGLNVYRVDASNRGGLDALCEALSPALTAQTWQGRSCYNNNQIVRGVLTRAAGWGGGGFFAAAVPCVGWTLGWGACVTGAATGAFVWGLMYEGYDAGTTCAGGGMRGPFQRFQ